MNEGRGGEGPQKKGYETEEEEREDRKDSKQYVNEEGKYRRKGRKMEEAYGKENSFLREII